MQVTYIEHARDRMRERHISEEDVRLTLESPDSTGPAQKGRTKYTKKVPGQQTPVRVVAIIKGMTADHFIVYTVF